MTDPLILRDEPIPGVVRLTLNRPDAFNALSEEMLSSLLDAFSTLSESPAIKVVILAASGRAYCAGHDLKQMRAQPSFAYYKDLFGRCSEVMLSIQKAPQIVIAQVQGIATAAGCQLVAMCDLAVSSNQARFAVSGVNLGLFCSTPSVALSRNLSRKQAMYMLATGELITAEQARDWGLINEVCEPGELEDATIDLARKIVPKPRVALQLGKQLFYEQVETNIRHAYELAGATMACNMMDESALEGVQAFIEKRKPDWK